MITDAIPENHYFDSQRRSGQFLMRFLGSKPVKEDTFHLSAPDMFHLG